MPIHQTKLTIANPHITGTSIPQIPTPRKSSTVSDVNNTVVRKKPIAMPRNHRQL